MTNVLGPSGSILDQVTPLRLTLGLSVVSALMITVCTISAYSVDTPLPPPGAPPARTKSSTSLRNYRFTANFYRSLVEEDIKKLGLAGVSLAALRAPNRHRKEFSGRRLLKVGGGFESRTLQLKLLQRKIWVGAIKGRVRAKHLILRISNKTNQHVAYNVQTEMTDEGRPVEVPGPCERKSAMAHNAIALAPQQSVERSECLALKKGRLYLRRIEILELLPLGYHYVSRLEPRSLLLDARTAEGHQPAKLPLCRLLPWQLLKAGISNGRFAWYDVVDFYSRHSCDEYSFFDGYRWSEKKTGKLPLQPPGG